MIFYVIGTFLIVGTVLGITISIAGAAVLLKSFWCDWKELDGRSRNCE